ncbi:MAG: hypothetical protein U0559_12545 [Anaerolineae bacterium]
MVSIATFAPKSMTLAQYTEIVQRLEQTGAGEPAGRLYHNWYSQAGQLQVTEIWESRESFERFHKLRERLLRQMGANAREFVAAPVHKLVHV